MKIDAQTWIISDTHFGHDNIIRYQDRPKNHDLIMLAEWAMAVQPGDTVLHLGDLYWSKGREGDCWPPVLALLPGEKYLILGNHDRQATGKYGKAGFTITKPVLRNGVAFTHYPITEGNNPFPDKPWSVNVHGHLHANNHRPEFGGFLIEGRRYVNVSVELMDYRPVRLGTLV